MCSVSALVMCDVDRSPSLSKGFDCSREVWGRLQSCANFALLSNISSEILIG